MGDCKLAQWNFLNKLANSDSRREAMKIWVSNRRWGDILAIIVVNLTQWRLSPQTSAAEAEEEAAADSAGTTVQLCRTFIPTKSKRKQVPAHVPAPAWTSIPAESKEAVNNIRNR